MNLLKRLAEEGQVPASNNPHGNPALTPKSFHNGVGTSSGLSSTASSDVTSEQEAEYSSPSKDD